ncbi:putative immunoglobulin-like protein [Medicago truncatula]|uniref:Putative immunoglobulin-like protein n=1 Tax=Medicago truncatula TaxID=3880 RepID=G7JWU8_MEDTR|nr:NDR1/HIN1-like protein 26 [Medicago truncatula]AES97023.2 transmembrane protein, putative [Medicago truncatula]RHN55548.1 putative immunoglobulin-like protein [Medicago truncatula]
MTLSPTSTHEDTLLMSSTDKETLENHPAFIGCSRLIILVPFVLILTYIILSMDVVPDSPSFDVESEGSLNSLTVNGTQLTAEFNISVSGYNFKSYSRVYYDDVSAEIFYRGEGVVLTKSSLPSFTTDGKSESVIHLTLSVNKSDDFGGAATGIARSRKDGTVEFGLIVKSLFKYKNRWAQSDWRPMKVVCNPLKFAVSPNDNNTTNPGILLEGLRCSST